MMNILCITPILPFPLSTGGNQAQFHFINYLQREMNIHFIFQYNSGNTHGNYIALKEKWPDVTFHPFNWKSQTDAKKLTVQKLFKRIQGSTFLNREKPFSRLSLLPTEDISESFLEFINEVIEKEKIDLVQIDFVPFLPIVYGLPKSVVKIFIQHEIRYVRNQLVLEQEANQSVFQQYLFAKMKDDEIAMMNKFDAVVTLTEVDRQKLLSDGIQTEVYASPAAISSEKLAISFKEFEKQLVFIGGAAHAPNNSGLQWFLGEVWPIILDNDPELQLQVIGNWPEKYINMLKGLCRNVSFLGFVENLDSVLSKSIMIIPILVGSGMRMKILEASQRGCPFITTSIGVEGLDFKDGEDCFIADQPTDFVSKLLVLIDDARLQKEFSKNAKQMFDRNYSIERLVEVRSLIYQNFIQHTSN